MHPLTERAMTMNLSIGIWQGYRLDKDASAKVTSNAGASADAARVNKHLIPKEDLAPLVTSSNAIRTHFYANTLPWRDNGDRLMPRKQFLEFIPAHEKLVAEFEAEVGKFLDERYPIAIERAEFRMGDMFKRDDYPHASELRRKFYAQLDIDAISTAEDFRVQIDQEHTDKIKATMSAAIEQRLAAATGDVWKRMAETVEYFRARMADPKAVFRDTTVTNIGDMLDLIPGLNVMDDPNIEMVRGLIAKAFGQVDAKDIRKDPAHRAQLASEAQSVMDKMAGFMKAFGAGDS